MILNFDRGYGQDTERMIQSLMESTQMALDTMERKLKAAGVDITEGKKTSIVDLVYPVGAIYMSMNETSPAELFGGVWERLGTGRTLISAGGGIDPVSDANSTDASGTPYDGTFTGNVDEEHWQVGIRGGETAHTLSATEMPSHTHIQNPHTHAGLRSGSVSGTAVKGGADYCAKGTISGLGSNSAATNVIYTVNTTATNQNTGGNGAHNNMPPYVAVYMWKRTE